MFTISWAEIAYGKDFLPACLYESLTLHETYDDETLVGDLEAMFDAMRPAVRNAFAEYGLMWDDTTIVVRDELTLTRCAALTYSIVSEYEQPDSHAVWTRYDLGGDDDVDYNGSYPDTILDILDALVPPAMRCDGHAVCDGEL